MAHDAIRISVDEYFKLREANPETRYEYVDGYVYMMTGGKRRHALIGNNVGSILFNLLRDKPCVTFNSDACIHILKLNDFVGLTSIGVRFPVAEIYEKTHFAHYSEQEQD